MKTLLFSCLFFGFLYLNTSVVYKEEAERKSLEDKASVLTEGCRVLSQDQFTGMQLFMRQCNACHPGGGRGVGPVITTDKIPVHFVHKKSINGEDDLPCFSEEDVNSKQHDQILEFIELLRQEKLKVQS